MVVNWDDTEARHILTGAAPTQQEQIHSGIRGQDLKHGPAAGSYVVRYHRRRILFLFMRQNRERTANAPLRGEIQVGVFRRRDLIMPACSARADLGVPAARGSALRGPKRLIVGADAFMISCPRPSANMYLPDASHPSRFSQAPSRIVQRDWIIITGQVGGRQVQLAITKKAGLPKSAGACRNRRSAGLGPRWLRPPPRRCQMTRPVTACTVQGMARVRSGQAPA